MPADLDEELQPGTGWHREEPSGGCQGGGGGGGGKWKKNNPDELKGLL